MVKVTILVAAYNAEPFLPKCLDSLLAQTLKEIQVVCIDDGSTDGTLTVLRRYAAADQRIEVIALPENHGQAYARNQGLKCAQGDYICFLDSDDWLSTDALEQAVTVFETCPATDSVLFQVDMVEPQGSTRYPLPSFTVLSGNEAFRLSLDWQLHGVYMVRTVIHQQYPYDDTCRSFSDDNTTRLHYLHSREVRQCQGVYYYRQHASSTSHVISVRQFDRMRANESMKAMLTAEGMPPEIMRQWEAMRMLVLVDCYKFYYCHSRELPDSDRSFALGEMRRVWQTIERHLLDSPKVHKFGYRPLPFWWLFRLQEWLYFTLRGLLGRNVG